MTVSFSQDELSLTLLGVGIALAALGALSQFVWRLPGVTVGTFMRAGSAAAVHPARYVRPDRLLAVRMVNMAAATCFLLGVLLLLVP